MLDGRTLIVQDFSAESAQIIARLWVFGYKCLGCSTCSIVAIKAIWCMAAICKARQSPTSTCDILMAHHLFMDIAANLSIRVRA